MPTTVDYTELESAMHFVSADSMREHEVRISRASGGIFWLSELIDEEEPLPDDIDDDECYVSVPSQRDLDLGKHLILKFMESELPEHQDEARRIFSRRGAYTRFKGILEQLGKLDDWYSYGPPAVRAALCEWACEEGIEVEVIERPSDAEANPIVESFTNDGLRWLSESLSQYRSFVSRNSYGCERLDLFREIVVRHLSETVNSSCCESAIS